MFLLSLLTNKDSYNTQIIQCVNDTIFRKRSRVPGFGTGSGTLEPVLWNRFLHQITTYTVSKLWLIIRQIFAGERGVPHFNGLAGGDSLSISP